MNTIEEINVAEWLLNECFEVFSIVNSLNMSIY